MLSDLKGFEFIILLLILAIPVGVVLVVVKMATPSRRTQPPARPGPDGGSPPAGWLPDPWQGEQLRYWDGTAWSGFTAPR